MLTQDKYGEYLNYKDIISKILINKVNHILYCIKSQGSPDFENKTKGSLTVQFFSILNLR